MQDVRSAMCTICDLVRENVAYSAYGLRVAYRTYLVYPTYATYLLYPSYPT